ARALVMRDFDGAGNPAGDPRVFKQGSIGDSEYETRPEQADRLRSSVSKNAASDFEHGASVYDRVVIYPVEQHAAPDERERFKVNQLSYAFDKIDNRRLAALFHKYCMMIAGADAGPGAEIDIFKEYYDRLDAEINRLWRMEQPGSASGGKEDQGRPL